MRCSHYHGTGIGADQCKAHATHWLFDPDGKQNPGGWACREHGDAVVEEYGAKLAEAWTLRPIDENGDLIPG